MFKYLSEVYGKGGIYAKCVAASIANDIPIYTIETKAPKFIDAEFEKHRMLSSNSSSSRAIPFQQLDEIYLPFDVRQKQKGMQGDESLSEEKRRIFINNLKHLYYLVSDSLWGWAGSVHKQHLNRYTESWMFQKKVVTATEWDNFFELRTSSAAQPEIQELARCMRDAIEMVEPLPLYHGEWHVPYISEEEWDINKWNSYATEPLLISAGRCARVSYDNIHSDKPPEKLAADLLIKKHMTPFEHQATPMPYIYMATSPNMVDLWENGITHIDKKHRLWSANFRGWIQYRKQIDET